MKKIILLLTALFAFIVCRGQISEKEILGRWIEKERIDSDNVITIPDSPDMYFFKENHIFHKGQAIENLVIFNITGKYEIDGDSVTITYNDYTLNKAQRETPKIMVFKILSLTKNKMLILLQDYTYEYKLLLKKEGI